MARLFISCNHQDYHVGQLLQTALMDKGHSMTLEVDAKPAGRWEPKLLRGLHTADVFICLLTPNGVQSSWVTAQTGQAISCEYTKRMLVLPVVPRGDDFPSFVSAFHCFWLTGRDPASVKKLADDLNEAIEAHVATRPPRIFISHRHKDEKVARAVIDLLQSAFQTQKRDIRCTSVPGFKLSVGAQSAASLQADLIGAEVVLGIVGPETAESDYVLFELGAAWGLETPTFPLRIGGATYEHVPEVLREKSSLALDDVSQCLQRVHDIGRVSSIARKKSSTSGKGAQRVQQQAQRLARAAKPRQ